MREKLAVIKGDKAASEFDSADIKMAVSFNAYQRFQFDYRRRMN